MKNLITYLKTLWGALGNLQSNDVICDRRSTVVRPSGLEDKLQLNTFVRFAATLVLVLTIGVGNVWGQSCTSMNGSTQDTQTTITSANAASGSAGTKISWSGDGTCSSSQWRFAANKSVTFTATSGYQITSIVFTSTSTSDYYGTWSATAGSKSTSGGATTFSSINSSSVTLKTTTAARMKTCVVTYTAAPSGYSITYHCNGATLGCPSNASGQSTLPNPLPTPTKSGFIFGGWYTNSTLTTAAVAGATLSANADLYAKWTCNVTLNRNGATEIISNVVEGTALDDIDGTGAQGGCSAWTFVGWSKTQRAAQNNSTPMTLVTIVDGVGPYYAVYSHTESGGTTTKNYSITFDDNGSDSSTDLTTSTFKGEVSGNADSISSVTSVTKCYAGAGGLKMSSQKQNGSFTLSLAHALPITKIVLNAKRGSTSGTYANGVTVGSTAFSTSSSYSTSFVDLEFTGTKTSSNSLTVTSTSSTAAGTSNANRVTWLSSITIYFEASGDVTYYSTTASCCTPLASINGSISLTQGGTSVTIKDWSAVSYAGSYTVKMYHYNTGTSKWDLVSGTSSSTSGSEGTKTGVTDISTGVTFTGLTLNDDYKFSVQAIAGSSAYCDGDETFATSINSTSVASTPFKLSYSIYMDNGSGSGWTDHLLDDDGTFSTTLSAGISYYQFGIRRGFDHGGWWAATSADNVYNTGGAEWTLNGSNNVRLQTFVGGTYTFTVDLSGTNPQVTISYPSATQDAGNIVYWDASVISNWDHLYFRVGTDAGANASADCKVDGNIVPGTDRFYKVTTASFTNMRVWAITNKEGWTGNNTNGVYKTNTGDTHAITKSTEYQDYAVDEGGVTLVPSSSGTIGSQSHDNNCYFYPVTKTDGMLTHNVAVGAKPTGGSITVTYTNTSGISGQTVTDGNNADLAHRCILNVVATPETGYNLVTFTKNASAFAGGNYILTEDVAFAATFSLKQTTVTLNNHEATTAGAASVTATYSQAVPSIAANLPAKTGYIFGGYWTGEDGTGTKYINADGTSANNWSIVDATTTLHAQWTPKRCTVTLTAGTGSNGSAVFDYDATTYVLFSPAVRVGWTCTGYWTETGGTGTKILNADGTRADNVAGWWVSDKWSVDNTSATLYAGWTNTYGGDEFELVLDLSELSAGKKIIILDKDHAYGLGTSGTNNRASVAASADGGFTMSGDNNVATLKAATSVQVITLEATGTANQYYLNVENGYLYANGTSSNNYLKLRENNSTNAEQGQFLFSLNNGDFTIQAQSGNTFNTYLREYSTSTFSCYSTASSNKAVLVYVKRESCDEPANALSLLASPTAISTATGFNTSTLSTTGGNGGTVYYRVISSNKANATIDGTTFSATTAGTYTVQAYQLKNDNICRQISTVDITVTTPILTTSKSSHPFEKTATGNSRNTNTIAISGANLVGDVSVALSGANADQFSISTTSVTAASAMESAQAITVTYSPTTTGAHTATITFSSTGAVDKTVTVTGTAADFYTVTWHISGSSNQTSQVESGTKPTFPSDPASCDDESTTFIGWTQTPWSGKLAQSAIDAKTADNVKVYKAASELPNVGGAIDYYAVWAKETSSVTDQTASFGFEEASPSAWTISNISQYASAYASGSYSGKCDANGNGNIITPNTIQYNTKLTTPTSISFKTARTGNTNAGNYWQVQSSSDGSIWSNVTDGAGPNHSQIANTNTFTDPFEVDLSDLSNVYIRINHNGSSPATLLDDIVLSYRAGSTTYSDYLTTCCENTGLTFGTIASPVTSYEIVRTSSAAATIDCNFESSTATEIKWYKTSRAARTFVTPTGATSSTAPSDQLAEMTIANKKLTASSVGVYTITIKQDEATIAGQKYCESFAEVTVTVKVRDRFVDMLNGEDVGVGGNGVITRDDTGGGIYTPTESDFDTDDLCKTTKRKLIGWIKAGDLKTSYGDANRVDEIDDLKTATPATNKIIAPNTQVQATGCTWYAVWADID